MDGGGERLPVDGNCGWPSVDGVAVRLRRTALEDGPGGRPPRQTSVGSSDAAVDVRTRDNPVSLLVSVLLTVPTRKNQGCSLPWSSMWVSIGIVIRIFANETASQLAITVVGESYRIVKIRTLTWSHMIILVCHHTRSDQKLGRLSSSVRRLYLVDRGCLLFFLFRLRIKYVLFQINVMDLFRCRSLAFACIMTRISTPGTPNVHPGSRNGSSWFPVFRQVDLDCLQSVFNAFHHPSLLWIFRLHLHYRLLSYSFGSV
jgi:hypothetical protein